MQYGRLWMGRYGDNRDFALGGPIAPEYAIGSRRPVLGIRFKDFGFLVKGMFQGLVRMGPEARMFGIAGQEAQGLMHLPE